MSDWEAQVAIVKSLKAELKQAKAEASTLMADPGLAERLADAAALSRRLDEADGDERLDLRIRINEILKGLVERVLFDEGTGAALVLKPRLDVRPQHGVVPYATRMVADKDGQMVVSVLVEEDATDVQIDRFLGFPDDVKRWAESA